jgi:hypothetical protein
MATAYTSLLGLALPVTGELSGSWGDTVNDAITSLLDTAVAGTTSITADADITLTTTTGVANQSRQAIILWNPASGTTTRNITAPAQSKIYTVINASGGTQSIVFRGAGPTTGVTIVKGESAVVAWNGTDFIKVSNTGGAASFTNVTVSGTTTLSGLTASTALALDASKNVVSVTNTGTGNNVLATSPTLVTPALGTPSSGTLTNATGLPVSTGISGLGSGVATFLATPSSANLAAAVTDETGTGALVFANSPTLVTPALGTPASGVVTNLTGTASININGTVGATTASTGAFTTLSATGVTTVQAGTVSAPAITTTGDTNTGIFFPAADVVGLSTGGTERVRVDASGNVGIGASSGLDRLTVRLDQNASTRIVINNQDAGSSAEASFRMSASGATWDIGTGSTARNSNSLTLGLVGSEFMRINSAGNVGIGTSSPGAKLDVNGNTRLSNGAGFTSANSLIRQLESVAGAANQFTVGSIGFLTGSFSDQGQITFSTNNSTGNTERMRLDSSGNLLVGKTAANNTALGFFVNTAGGVSGVTSGDSWYCNKATGYADSVFIRFQINATSVGFISTDGTSTTYSTTSDYRLKNTVVPITGALAKVALLKPVTYKWNIDGSDGQGFIAHELQEVAPECVTGEKDAVDEEGKPVYQGIDTSFLVATLTAAIQELKAEFDAYKASHP